MRMDFVRSEKGTSVTVCNGAVGLCLILCALSSPLKGKEWEVSDPFKSQHRVVREWNFENQSLCSFYFSEMRPIPWEGGLRRAWPPFRDSERVAPSLWESPGLSGMTSQEGRVAPRSCPKAHRRRSACQDPVSHCSLLSVADSFFSLSSDVYYIAFGMGKKNPQNINPAFYYRS